MLFGRWAMNTDHTLPPFQPGITSAVTSRRTQHSNRASPFPRVAITPVAATTTASFAATSGTTTTAVDNEPMATPGFPAAFQAFRQGSLSQAPYQTNMSNPHFFDRDASKQPGAPFANSSSPPGRVLIRRLPLNTSEEALRLMVVWSKELSDVELLPVEHSEDSGFRSALLRFTSVTGALEAKTMLDGRSNISNDAAMVVELLPYSPSARRHGNEPQSAGHSSAASSAASSAPGSRQPSRFNGTFQSMEKISPTSNGAFPAHDFPNPDASSRYHDLFSAQSPIGNHLSDRTHVSGKFLINNDFADDDETSDLLKDPVGYAENGAPSHRRATAPQIPVNRMAGLSLNTNGHSPGPSSLPQYMSPMSPVNGGGPAPGMGYPAAGGPPFQRHNFPPVNPADQNPPCNTLYVGNLPLDTSEEELKAMFSKQRGYKRLCFRTKQNGPMCFVEFEEVSFATKALHDLYGTLLHNSVKGGIRLSFSKNPLGVRSGQSVGQAPATSMGSMNGMMAAPTNGFTTASGPPPGLAAPPGLGAGRANYNLPVLNTGGHHHHPPLGFPGSPNHVWNGPVYNNGVAAAPNGGVAGNSNFLPRHMMGR